MEETRPYRPRPTVSARELRASSNTKYVLCGMAAGPFVGGRPCAEEKRQRKESKLFKSGVFCGFGFREVRGGRGSEDGE